MPGVLVVILLLVIVAVQIIQWVRDLKDKINGK
jgi:hypothetical protein